MSAYTIKRQSRAGEGYESMVIIDRAEDSEIAEYRLTPGEEKREIAAMRRTLNRHLENGGTLGNYQW